jgi:hypothetical protein
MDLIGLSKKELLEKCAEFGIIKCKSKNKSELISLINNKDNEENKINKISPLGILIEFIIHSISFFELQPPSLGYFH